MGPIIGEVLQALQTEILSGRLPNENAEIVSWIRNNFNESK
jgi:tRNA adenylyltransferase